ncbi:immunoglobulin i-set domain-containing protein [Ditylenchus destructor]|nr:immunoglobulin i-set domain-containing protein [Ditylenchus destructor]
MAEADNKKAEVKAKRSKPKQRTKLTTISLRKKPIRKLKPIQRPKLKTKQRAEAEARTKAEFDKKKAEEEAKKKAEAEAKTQAEADSEKVEVEAKKKAEAKTKAEADNKKAEEEAKKKAEAKTKAEADNKKAEEEAKNKAEADAKTKAEAESETKAEFDSKKAEEEAKKKTRAKTKAEADSDTKAESDNKKADKETKKKAEAKTKAQAEARTKAKAENKSAYEEAMDQAEAEGKSGAEPDAKTKAEPDTKTEADNKKSDEETKNKAEADAKTKAEAESETKAEADNKKAKEEAKKKAEAEAKTQAEADSQKAEVKAKKKAEAEGKTQAEADSKKAKEPEEKTKTKAELETITMSEAESKTKAEVDNRKANKEAQKKAESETKAEADKKKADEEAKKMAEAEIKPKAEPDNNTAEEEAKKKAEANRKIEADGMQAEEVAKKKAEAKPMAEAEPRTKAESDSKKAEEEAKKKAEANTKGEVDHKKAEEKAKKEVEAKTKAESETKAESDNKKADKEAKKKAEAYTKAEADDLKAEEEAKKKCQGELKAKQTSGAHIECDFECDKSDVRGLYVENSVVSIEKSEATLNAKQTAVTETNVIFQMHKAEDITAREITQILANEDQIQWMVHSTQILDNAEIDTSLNSEAFDGVEIVLNKKRHEYLTVGTPSTKEEIIKEKALKFEKPEIIKEAGIVFNEANFAEIELTGKVVCNEKIIARQKDIEPQIFATREEIDLINEILEIRLDKEESPNKGNSIVFHSSSAQRIELTVSETELREEKLNKKFERIGEINSTDFTLKDCVEATAIEMTTGESQVFNTDQLIKLNREEDVKNMKISYARPLKESVSMNSGIEICQVSAEITKQNENAEITASTFKSLTHEGNTSFGVRMEHLVEGRENAYKLTELEENISFEANAISGFDVMGKFEERLKESTQKDIFSSGSPQIFDSYALFGNISSLCTDVSTSFEVENRNICKDAVVAASIPEKSIVKVKSAPESVITLDVQLFNSDATSFVHNEADGSWQMEDELRQTQITIKQSPTDIRHKSKLATSTVEKVFVSNLHEVKEETSFQVFERNIHDNIEWKINNIDTEGSFTGAILGIPGHDFGANMTLLNRSPLDEHEIGANITSNINFRDEEHALTAIMGESLKHCLGMNLPNITEVGATYAPPEMEEILKTQRVSSITPPASARCSIGLKSPNKEQGTTFSDWSLKPDIYEKDNEEMEAETVLVAEKRFREEKLKAIGKTAKVTTKVDIIARAADEKVEKICEDLNNKTEICYCADERISDLASLVDHESNDPLLSVALPDQTENKSSNKTEKSIGIAGFENFEMVKEAEKKQRRKEEAEKTKFDIGVLTKDEHTVNEECTGCEYEISKENVEPNIAIEVILQHILTVSTQLVARLLPQSNASSRSSISMSSELKQKGSDVTPESLRLLQNETNMERPVPSPLKLRSTKIQSGFEPKPQDAAPQFLSRQKRLNVECGQKMIIKLRLYANPEPRVCFKIFIIPTTFQFQLSVYKGEDFMHEDENVHVIIERDQLLYSILLLVDATDESWDGQKLTFVATNEHGFDKAVVMVKMISSLLPDEDNDQKKKDDTEKQTKETAIKPAQEVDLEDKDEKKRKKKNVPAQLFIPKEITSLYGDPSVLVSTASMSTELESGKEDQIAETVSPRIHVEKKLDSAKKTKVTPIKDEPSDFDFKEQKEKPKAEEPKELSEREKLRLEMEERRKRMQTEKEALEKERKERQQAEIDRKKKAEEEAKKKLEDTKKQREEALKQKVKDEADKKKREAEDKKIKEEQAKRKADELKKIRAEEAEAKKKIKEDADATKTAKEKADTDVEKKKSGEEDAKKKTREEALKKRREAEEKTKAEEEEAKRKMEEMARKRQEGAKKREEEARKAKEDAESKRKKDLEAKRSEEEEAYKKASEAMAKALEEQKVIEETRALEKRKKTELEKISKMPSDTSETEDKDKKKQDELERIKREQEAALKQKVKDEAEKTKKDAEDKKAKQEEEVRNKEVELKRRREEEEAKKKAEVDKKKEVVEVPDKEKAEMDSSRNKEREEALKKKTKKDENAKVEENEAKRKMEELKRNREEAAKKKEENAKKTKEEAEAKRKADIEDKRRKELDAKKEADEAMAMEKQKMKEKADAEVAKIKLEEKNKMEAEAKSKAETEKKKSEEEAKVKAEALAKAQADKMKDEVRKKAEAEAKADADKKKADDETKEKAMEEAKKAEADKKTTEAESKKKAEADKKKADDEAKKKFEIEAAKKKAEEEIKKKAEAEAKTKAEADKKKAEEEAKKKAEAEAKTKAEADKKKAEEEAKKKAQADKKKAVEEKAKSEENEAKKIMEEMKKKREGAAKKKEDDARKAKEEAEEKRKQEAEAKRLEAEEAKKRADDALAHAAEEKKVKEVAEAEEKRRHKTAEEELKAKEKEELDLLKKAEADAKKKREDEKQETDRKKAEETAEAKRKVEETRKLKIKEEVDRRKAEADAKKTKEEEDAKKRAEDLKKRREDAAAKKKAEDDAKKSKEVEKVEKVKPGTQQNDADSDAKKKTREEMLRKRREAEEKAKIEENEAKNAMEEMKRKREEAAKRREEELRRSKMDAKEREKLEKEDREKAAAKAKAEADEALRQAMENRQTVDTSVEKFILEEEQYKAPVVEEAKKSKEELEKEERRKALEKSKLDKERLEKEKREAEELAKMAKSKDKSKGVEEAKKAKKPGEGSKKTTGKEAEAENELENVKLRKREEEEKKAKEAEKGELANLKLKKRQLQESETEALKEMEAQVTEQAAKATEEKHKQEFETLQKAELEQKSKAEEVKKLELETRQKTELEKKKKAEEEAKKEKADAFKKERDDRIRKRKEEDEKLRKEQEEAKNKMEEMKRKRAETEKEKKEEAIKAKEEAEAIRKGELDAKRKAELEAKEKAEAERNAKAKSEAMKKAEETSRKAAEDEEKKRKVKEEEDMKNRKKLEEEEIKKKADAAVSEKSKQKPEVKEVQTKPPQAPKVLDEAEEAVEAQKAKETLEKLKKRKKVVKPKPAEEPGAEGEERRTLEVRLASPAEEKSVFSDFYQKTEKITPEKASATVIEYQKEEDVDKHVESIIRKAKHHREEVEESFAELDEVEEFLNQRRQRLHLDEIQVEDYMLRAIRHRQRRAGFVSLPDAEILALRGDTAVVECELFNEEDNVTWTINGQPVSSEPRAVIEDYAYIHKLLVRDVIPTDSGMTVTVTLGHQTFESVLKVEEIPVEFARKLDWKRVGIVSQTLRLTAELSHQAERVEWFHNGEKIREGDESYRISFSGLVQNLELLNIKYSMEGRYSLQVDEVECSTIVDIHGPPIIERPAEGKKSLDVDAHDTLMFQLKIRCMPEPEVQLIFNGVPLPADIRTTWDVMETAAVVCHRQATKADKGSYRVRLFNEYGEDYEDFDAYVINEVGHDYAVVTWSAPSDDGGAPITGYLVEKKGIHRRLYQQVGKVSSHTHELFIDDLDMETEYVFHVAAINRFGVGEFSRDAEISTGIPYTAPSMKSAPTIVSTRDRKSYYHLTTENGSLSTDNQTYDKSCRLEWDECTDVGGSPLYGYDVYVRDTSGAQWQKLNEETVFTNSYFVDEQLQQGNTYEFKVEASNQAGLHSNSNMVSAPLTVSSTSARPGRKLPAPSIMITSTDTVAVSWQEQSAEEGGRDVSYIVHYKSEGATVWNGLTAKHSPLAIDGLKEGVSYVFKVAPQNQAGIGEFSEESEPVKVSPLQKPTITKGLKNTVVPKKEELRLECYAVGEPAPSYIWYKDGREITPEDDNISISNQGFMSSLRVRRMSSPTAGTYKCEVYNQHGKQETVARINVTDIRAHFVTSFAEHIQVTEHKNVVLECEVSDPEAVVYWFKNKRSLAELASTNSRLKIEAVGCIRRLTIEKALQEDSGYYACETSDERSRTQADVMVKAEEPHIKFSPQDTIVTSFGGKVVLTCEITKEVPSIKWLKNGYELWQQTGKYFPLLEDTTASLEIYNFDERDMGEYCVVLPNNERSAPAHVRLEVPPHIELSKEVRENEEVIVHAGQDLHFEAQLIGWPKPRFEALHNEGPLRALGSVDDYEDNCFVVRLNNLNRRHSGRVTLKAENAVGDSIKFFHIRVLDVPNAPRRLEVLQFGATSADLRWEASREESEHCLPVEYYGVERKTAKHGRWRQVARVRPSTEGGMKQLSYTTNELFPDEIYVFRAVDVLTPADDADNEYDEDLISSMSASSDTTLALDRPEKPNIKSDNVKVEVSWRPVDRAVLYGVERRRTDENMWLEIANTDRVKMKRSQSPISLSEDLPSKSLTKQKEASPGQAGASGEEGSQSSTIRSQSIQDSGIGLPGSDNESRSSSKAEQMSTSISAAYPSEADAPPKAAKKVVKKVVKKKVGFKESDETSAVAATQEVATKDASEEKGLTSKKVSQPKDDSKIAVPKLEFAEGLAKEVSLAEGESKELAVEWRNGSISECTWSKDGALVDKTKLSVKGQTSVYKIREASQADAGLYRCSIVAENNDQISWEINVSITVSKPTVKFESEKNLVKKFGESLNLAAKISPSSIKDSAVQWSLNGSTLDVNSRNVSSSWSTATGKANLSIRKLDISHNGKFEIKVETANGLASDCVELQVMGPPPPPTGPLEVITSSQSKASQFGKQILKWNPPQNLDQCGAPLLGYCVEKRDTRKSTWTFMLRTKETQADVGEILVNGVEYLFRVAAENKFGAGEALEMAQPFQVTQKGVGKEPVQGKESGKGGYFRY